LLNYQKLQESILNWFFKNKRDLPWRQNRNWYKVWISEIMLQQTKVEQVIIYFHNFIKEFPTVQDLANADLQKILKVWEGLGYYSRARNLHKTAKILINQFGGDFPSFKNDIIKLPGIGEYTANAILSIVYNKPYSVVDGNVIRVISRLFGITKNIRLKSTLKEIKSKTEKLLPQNDSANFNEALMEIGALICLPKNPNCQKCPLFNSCQSKKNDIINLIPYKPKKVKKPFITVIVQIIKSGNEFYLVKRKDKGLLGGFWEFPFNTIKNINDLKMYTSNRIYKEIKHSYTHFNLLMIPIHLKKNELIINDNLYEQHKWLTIDKIKIYPIHRGMQKILRIIENN
jgi:A/G-specific adenine glycosylase